MSYTNPLFGKVRSPRSRTSCTSNKQNVAGGFGSYFLRCDVWLLARSVSVKILLRGTDVLTKPLSKAKRKAYCLHPVLVTHVGGLRIKLS